jgi:hypothetical protein
MQAIQTAQAKAFSKLKEQKERGVVTHDCIPSYSVARDFVRSWFKISPGKKFARLHLNQGKAGHGGTACLSFQESGNRKQEGHGPGEPESKSETLFKKNN